MGKKSRKKKTAARRQAPPPMPAHQSDDISNNTAIEQIDNSVCAVCNAAINVFHWDANAFVLRDCCGVSVCRDCNKEGKSGFKIENQNLPGLLTLSDGQNLQCRICNTFVPAIQKGFLPGIMKRAESGHLESQFFLLCSSRDKLIHHSNQEEQRNVQPSEKH